MPFLRSGKEVDLQKEVPKKNNKKNKKVDVPKEETVHVAKEEIVQVPKEEIVQVPKEEIVQVPKEETGEEPIDAIVIDQTFLPDKPIVQIKGDHLVHSKSISNCSIC